MLCKYCEDLDLDLILSISGFLRHKGIKDLHDSASEGCELCKFICSRRPDPMFWGWPVPPENVSSLVDGQIICRVLNWSPAQQPRPFRAIKFWQPKEHDKIDCLNISVDIFTTREDPVSLLVSGRPVPFHSDSNEAFETVSQWIQECKRSHSDCRPRTSILPTRLVDVGASDEEARLFISNGVSGEWAVLSHCWGSCRDGITTKDKSDARLQNLGTADLPILYRDAISITRRLGLRYLWIDSLCIFQDSPVDWRLESSKMDRYYSCSALNISASGAPSPSVGIFSAANARRPSSDSFPIVPCHSAVHNLTGKIQVRSLVEYDQNNALSKRAWVLQESVLSPRILWYDIDQLRWECDSIIYAEEVPSWAIHYDERKHRTGKWRRLLEMSPNEARKRNQDVSSNLATQFNTIDDPTPLEGALFWCWWWYFIVEGYMNRDMKFPDDRLPGIAGLAKEFARRTGFTYKCGVWEEDMLSGLRWKCHGEKVPTLFSTRPPSWSWACTNGWKATAYEDMYSREQHLEGYDAVVIDISVENEDDDPFGQVTSASLTIRGRCRHVNSPDNLPAFFDTKETRRARRVQKIEHKVSTKPERIICTLDRPSGPEDHSHASIHPEAIYLILGKWSASNLNNVNIDGVLTALILEPVEGTDEEYQRVGIAEIAEDEEVNQWPTRTVVII